MHDHAFALGRVFELNAFGPLDDPVEKELGRFLADLPLARNLDVIRTGAGKSKGLGIGGDGPHQEPAALVEFDRREFAAGLGPFIEPHFGTERPS